MVGLRGQETNLSPEDLLRFMGALNRSISMSIMRGEGIVPRFRSVRLWRGHILAVTENEETREWVRRELVNIRPWGLANLVEVNPERLRLRRLAVWIPGLGADVSDEALLRCLGAQNGMDSSSWRVWRRTEEQKGSRLVMGVDEGSANAIAAGGSVLFCLALKVKVTIAASGHSQKEGSAEAQRAGGAEAEEILEGGPSAGVEGAAPEGAPGTSGVGTADMVAEAVASGGGSPEVGDPLMEVDQGLPLGATDPDVEEGELPSPNSD